MLEHEEQLLLAGLRRQIRAFELLERERVQLRQELPLGRGGGPLQVQLHRYQATGPSLSPDCKQ